MRIFCHECSEDSDEAAFLNKRGCISCGGHLRPEIVLFGEMLPQDEWGKTIVEIEQSDLLIVIGSSLQVAPANDLPFLSDGRKVIINTEETFLHSQFDLQIEGKVGDVLELIQENVIGGM